MIDATYEIAMAAARDAANRHMQEEGRVIWNMDDRTVAARTFQRIMDSGNDNKPVKK